MVNITIHGESFATKSGITIISAMENHSIDIKHHCSCKSGMCGACTCLIKYKNSNKIVCKLACQTLVEDGMDINFPTAKNLKYKSYNLDLLKKSNNVLTYFYNEIYACVNCGACTKNCTQSIDCRKLIENAKFGDIKTIAKLSFPCIACKACEISCPANICHSEVFTLARRVHSLRCKTGDELELAIDRNNSKKTLDDLDKFAYKSLNELKDIFAKREIEK